MHQLFYDLLFVRLTNQTLPDKLLKVRFLNRIQHMM